MKKIYVYFYAHNNLGDDLFLKLLLERYKNKDVRFYTITSPQAVKHFKNEYPNFGNKSVFAYLYYGLRKLSYMLNCNALYKLADVLKHIYVSIFFDAAVTIGGSIFMQSKEADYYKNHTDKPVSSRRNYLIGANIGPYKDKEFVDYVNRMLSQYDGVCVRDSISYSLISDKSNAEQAPDVVFCLGKKACTKAEKSLLVCPVNPQVKCGISPDEYYHALADRCDCFAENGCKVYLVSFCSQEGDDEAVAGVMSGAEHKDMLQIVRYDGSNFDFISELFATSDYVIAGRFHSLILSLLNGNKVFPVCYDTKTENYIRDIAQVNDCLFCDIDKLDLLKSLTPEKLDNSTLAVTEEYMRSSERQFRCLDKYIDS